jgi:hypothetical protein
MSSLLSKTISSNPPFGNEEFNTSGDTPILAKTYLRVVLKEHKSVAVVDPFAYYFPLP